MKMSFGAFLLAACLHSGSAASLRAAPVKESTPVVSDQVAAIIAKAEAANASKTAATDKAAAAPPVQHKKLDVGFAAFEEDLKKQVSAKLVATATGAAWNDDMRSKFTKNVTDALHDTLKTILQPVKQSIGKTWMALPKDEQKDEYVDTLKKSFASVFDGSMKTVLSHMELSLKRVEAYSQQKSPALPAAELLEKSEFSVADSLVKEHCYESDIKKSLKSIAKPANATELTPEKKKFCIQSVIGALAHRLNDTSGLISMSMRFDAGAMSLAQKAHKAPHH